MTQPRRLHPTLRVPLRTVSPKVLSETLRAMERDGLVTRDAYDEYSLTPLGRSLLTLVDAARSWCAEHLDELLAARATDARRG